jgi:hypothetical protein
MPQRANKARVIMFIVYGYIVIAALRVLFRDVFSTILLSKLVPNFLTTWDWKL